MKVEEVRALGKALLVSRANVNNCSTLLSLLSSASSVECLLEAVRCLQAFFLPLLSPEGLLGKSKNLVESETPEGIYRTWLKDKYEEFTESLIKCAVGSGESRLQNAALDALMELLQANGGHLDSRIYFKFCEALAGSRHVNENIFDTLATEHCREANVCIFTVTNLNKLVNLRLQKVQRGLDSLSSDDDGKESKTGTSVHTFIRNTYGILSRLSPFIQEALKQTTKLAQGTSETEANIKRMKAKVKKLWLSFLQLPLPLDVYKKVLSEMSKVVIPTLSNPIHLSDFLTKSYDIGGLYSVLSLDGLYILITKYGLEYPEFYDKLYSLLEPSIFFTKYRSRFFELMDTCLKSPLIPAYLAAAFAKKLSRLSLCLSPAGALLVIAMVHNLLRRHPSINCLVHRVSREKAENGEAGLGKDPFLVNETKTSECHALESSLWEIESLRRHYCPAVSRFVSTLETDLTVRAKTTEVQISDFSSGSYSTIFNEETKRRLKQVPLAYYKVVPGKLFQENEDEFAEWSFTSDLESPALKKTKVV